MKDRMSIGSWDYPATRNLQPWEKTVYLEGPGWTPEMIEAAQRANPRWRIVPCIEDAFLVVRIIEETPDESAQYHGL
jgi:hypothetical protein